MKRPRALPQSIVLGWILLSASLIACGSDGSGAPGDNGGSAGAVGVDGAPDVSTDAGASAGSGGGTAPDGSIDAGGSGGAGGCAKAADCDDGFACTVDSCTANKCAHQPGPNSGVTACPGSQYCDIKKGCTDAPACADDAQCQTLWKAEPCKANVACNPVSATCTFTALDKDMDGHSPIICGGDDCDDTAAAIYGGAPELCDAKDNGCSGSIDVGATCPGLLFCSQGACVCPPSNSCGSACVDKNTDTDNCGDCGHGCPVGGLCDQGTCECPAGQTPCFLICVDPKTSPKNCGTCGHVCNSTCSGGLCDPACDDNVQNGSETDLDCGGPLCAKCGVGKSCNASTDCAVGQCVAGKCAGWATIAFGPGTSYASGTAPAFAVAADLTGDGKVDVATANRNDSTGIELHGTGTGTLNFPYSFMAGPQRAIHISAADLNLDGNVDLIVSDDGFNSVNMVLGTGNGGLKPPSVQGMSGAPYSTAVADFDADGKPDLAVANHGQNTVNVMYGTGSGSVFSGPVLPAGAGPAHVIALDLDKDSKPDIVVTNLSGNSASVFHNTGSGFTAQSTLVTDAGPRSVAGGDLNGDGWPDLAIADSTSIAGAITLFAGTGASFTSLGTLTGGTKPQWVIMDDFNQDGIKDIAVAYLGSSNVGVFHGVGNGTFGAAQTYPCLSAPSSIASADLNADGLPDLVVASSVVEVFLNTSH